jgi:hypothetical protein
MAISAASTPAALSRERLQKVPEMCSGADMEKRLRLEPAATLCATCQFHVRLLFAVLQRSALLPPEVHEDAAKVVGVLLHSVV